MTEEMLRQTLLDCQADEVSHRDEAAFGPAFKSTATVVVPVVGAGSAAAVRAKRV